MGHAAPNISRRTSSRTCDIGMGRRDDDIDARSLDMQRVDGRRSGISPRGARLLVDNNTDAAGRRDGEVRVGGKDWLTRDDEPIQLGVLAVRGLSISEGGVGMLIY